MRLLFAMSIALTCVAPSAAQDEKIAGKTIKQWSAALRSGEARTRYQALAALYEAGEEASPLLKEMIPLLKDAQTAIRRAAAMTIGNCKGDAASAVPALVQALKDADPWVRHLASQALTEIGENATDPLVKMLDDKEANTRYYAIMTMNGLGLQSKDVAKALGKAARDANALVRQSALFALSKIETDDPDVFALLGAALGDKEKQVRLSAASILVGKGKEGSSALARAAEDPQSAARMLALQALASLGEEIDEKGVLALRKALADEDAKIRQTAALGIANLGKTARDLGGDKAMFDALAKLLNDKDSQLRRNALLALGNIGADNADEIKLVAGSLKDADYLMRGLAVQALAKYLKDVEGEDLRKELIDRLIEALRDNDRRVQFLAAQAVAQQTLFVVEPLTKLVEEGKGMQRLWAATILGEIGQGASDAVPALQKMAKDANPQVRQVATAALQKIQAESK